MGFLKLLLNIGLILATSTVFYIDGIETDYRLPNNAIPIHYKINLTPYLEEGNFTFYGESNAKIEIRVASPKISLHSKELEINETATTLIKDDGTIYKPTEHNYNDETNTLTLNFGDALSPGFYTLNMKFAGNLLEIDHLKTGFMKIPYSNKEGNNTWLAVTYLEPNGARQMFPCWDEPALKATFDISVIHHQKYEVLSNMPIREHFTEQDGMVRTHFNTTPIMSTYLVAIIVMSDFARVPNANETINVWSSSFLISQTKFAHSIAENVTSLLTEYTNTTAIVPKIDHVLVEKYSIDGMENWGLIIYNGLNIIYNDSTDPTFKRIQIAQIIGHEIAHQWFGNLVTPSWWSYLWLSEGFATFFQAYALNKIFKDWRAMEFFVMENLYGSFLVDIGLMNSVTIDYKDAIQTFSAVYRKASVLLRMLHHTITDEVFRKGIITYLSTYQFSSATPDDLWSAMQSALDKSDVPHEGYRVKEVMDTWINQKRYPVVNVVKNYETGEVTISQECFRGQEIDECINMTWWIPVTFATQSNPSFSNTVPSYWLRPNQNISFRINPDDWIILNIQQTGYYRVNYDKRNWQDLIHYLNSENYMRIHVLNRAQIINDAFVFVRDRQINGTIFDNLINFLLRDTDYVAWYPMFQILKWWQNSFSLPESRSIKLHMVELLDVLLQNVGYEENPHDDDITKMKRLNALKWACIVGHEKCKEIAADKLSKHLADPDIHKIPQWWQNWLYCAGMMSANRTTWDKMLELYQQKSDITILKSLSCAENSDIIINYLNIIASNTSLFNIRIHYLAFIFITEKHASNDLILDYILRNIKNIRPKLVPITTTIKFLLSYINSNEQIDKVKRFSETYIQDINPNINPDAYHKFHQQIEKRKEDRDKIVNDYIKPFVREFCLSHLIC